MATNSTDQPRPRRSSRPSHPSRTRSQRLILAAIAAVTVVAVAVIVVVNRGGGHSTASTATTAVSTTTGPAVGGLPPGISGKVPPGDYGPFCAEAHKQVAQGAGQLTPARLKAGYAKIDFARLKAVAPEGMRSGLQLLIDTRQDITVLLGQVKSFDEIQPADLPTGFVQAFVTLSLAFSQKCDRNHA